MDFRHLIDGQWQDSLDGQRIEVLDPCTARTFATLARGDAPEVDMAVAAARRALQGPGAA